MEKETNLVYIIKDLKILLCARHESHVSVNPLKSINKGAIIAWHRGSKWKKETNLVYRFIDLKILLYARHEKYVSVNSLKSINKGVIIAWHRGSKW